MKPELSRLTCSLEDKPRHREALAPLPPMGSMWERSPPSVLTIIVSYIRNSFAFRQTCRNNANPPPPSPSTVRPLLVAPKVAALPTVEKPRRALAASTAAARADSAGSSTPRYANTLATAPVLATVPATILEPHPIISSATAQPLFVSELPQGHFAYPVVSEPNMVGELRLKALIGADGSVKEVSLLSGNPKLAEVAMRAVRQWHYSPYRVLGNPVEVETQIKMNFFGEDAVSIASVANAPGSLRESPALDPDVPGKLRP